MNDGKPPSVSDAEFEEVRRELRGDPPKSPGGPKPPPGPEADEAPLFSDDDLALRFADKHASVARYVDANKRWFFWTGKLWLHDETREVFTRSRTICRAAAAESNKRAERKQIASAKSVNAVVSLSSADLRIAARIDQWDADPWLLNTPNGAVDLRTGAIRSHRADDHMTKITAVGPGGECPMFLKFIDRIMASDEELIAFIQRTLGYCLTGNTNEQAIFFAYGTGQKTAKAS
jgi:putative DNA primase/helicase